MVENLKSETQGYLWLGRRWAVLIKHCVKTTSGDATALGAGSSQAITCHPGAGPQGSPDPAPTAPFPEVEAESLSAQE